MPIKSASPVLRQSLLLAVVVLTIHVLFRHEALHSISNRRDTLSASNTLVKRSFEDIQTFSHDHDTVIDSPAFLPYLTWYQGLHTLEARVAVAFSLVVWLAFLFACVGIVASDYFCPNLSTISSKLGLSESVAGSTLLAFGNGSPDVFSTFASLGANSGSLAIGELLGAATFIVSVVAGSMTLVAPFKIQRHTFLRDVAFFTAAALLVLVILWDNKITRLESGAMVILYVVYVLVVAIGSWWHSRRERQRELMRRARAEYAAESMSEEEGQGGNKTPKQPTPARSLSSAGVSPLISFADAEDDLDEEDESMLPLPSPSFSIGRQHSALRSRHRSKSLSIGRTRPSLLGAVEFRDVVNSLAADSSVSKQLAAFPDIAEESPERPQRPFSLRRATSHKEVHPARTSSRDGSTFRMPAHQRSRSIAPAEGCSNGEPMSHSIPDLVDLDVANPWKQDHDLIAHHHATSEGSDSTPSTATLREAGMRPKDVLRLHIPSDESPNPFNPSFPFSPPQPTPGSVRSIHKVPSIVVMNESGQISPASVPGTPVRALSRRETFVAAITPFSDGRRRKVRCLGRAICGTLFPSLGGFRNKSWVAALLAIAAVPAIFCLVLTLPVVDEEGDASSASDLHEKEVHPPYKDDEEEYRAERRDKARKRDEHIAHQLHSPVMFHSSSRDGYFDAKAVNADDLEDSLRQLTGEGEQSKDQSRPPSFYEDRTPPSSPVSDEEQAAADRQVSTCLTTVQCIAAPVFCVAALTSDDPNIWYWVAAACTSAVLGLVSRVIVTRWSGGRVMLCVIGFIVSMVWLLTIVNEVVGVLQAIGHVFGLSDSILGVTIFALGNSTADLVANLTIAKMGYPQMAISACFGGPLLNILLGVGLSGSYYIHASGHSYPIKFDPTLLATCVALIAVLVASFVFVPMNGYMMTRKWGLSLIGFYLSLVAVNVFVEIKF